MSRHSHYVLHCTFPGLVQFEPRPPPRRVPNRTSRNVRASRARAPSHPLEEGRGRHRATGPVPLSRVSVPPPPLLFCLVTLFPSASQGGERGEGERESFLGIWGINVCKCVSVHKISCRTTDLDLYFFCCVLCVRVVLRHSHTLFSWNRANIWYLYCIYI